MYTNVFSVRSNIVMIVGFKMSVKRKLTTKTLKEKETEETYKEVSLLPVLVTMHPYY